jgi:hypothetical protein
MTTNTADDLLPGELFTVPLAEDPEAEEELGDQDPADDLALGSATFEAAQVSRSGDGRRGWAKFTIGAGGAVSIIEAGFSETAYDVVFDKLMIGRGLTVSTVSAKRDADNGTPSSIVFAVPQSAIPDLAKAMRLIGRSGRLVLAGNQLAFDLTKRAE